MTKIAEISDNIVTSSGCFSWAMSYQNFFVLPL